MRTDLDGLILARGLDAVMVLGSSAHNPPMYYLAGGGRVSNAALIKKPGAAPVIYCNAMERDEAAKSGLAVVPSSLSGVDSLLQNPLSILERHGLERGKLGIYGTLDTGDLISILRRIRDVAPSVEITSEPKEDSLFLRAMETKDAEEVAHIRRMGAITVEVVAKVAELLTSSQVRKDEVLLKDDGTALRVADVKARISLWLAERGAEEADGTIFAIGKDAGIPHSIGTPEDVMRLGQTIVFDIFPAEAGGGYFYDFTRTWSLGYASPDVEKLYSEVQSAYDLVVENVDLNVSFKEYQKLVSERFRTNGHDTPMHTEGTLEHGYVHSLGHGVGLNIHERPWSRHTAADDNLLRPGVVITLEPGLYYPEKGMGARIEDTYWVRPDGVLEKLADYSYDLVLPMKHWKPT